MDSQDLYEELSRILRGKTETEIIFHFNNGWILPCKQEELTFVESSRQIYIRNALVHEDNVMKVETSSREQPKELEQTPWEKEDRAIWFIRGLVIGIALFPLGLAVWGLL